MDVLTGHQHGEGILLVLPMVSLTMTDNQCVCEREQEKWPRPGWTFSVAGPKRAGPSSKRAALHQDGLSLYKEWPVTTVAVCGQPARFAICIVTG